MFPRLSKSLAVLALAAVSGLGMASAAHAATHTATNAAAVVQPPDLCGSQIEDWIGAYHGEVSENGHPVTAAVDVDSNEVTLPLGHRRFRPVPYDVDPETSTLTWPAGHVIGFSASLSHPHCVNDQVGRAELKVDIPGRLHVQGEVSRILN